MKLLANENIPYATKRLLSEAGYDIEHIAEKAPSITDEEVVEISIQEKRVIITFDSDYGTLIFREDYQPHGVIYLRFKEFTPTMPAELLIELFQNEDYEFEQYFTVIDHNNIRQRKIL